MAMFSGFHSPTYGPVEELCDFELIKQDLINHFNTEKGERLMDSEYGFIGWELIFELKLPGVKALIEQDARRIVNTDPRVSERSITVTEEENGFTVSIELEYVLLNSCETLSIFFDETNATNQL